MISRSGNGVRSRTALYTLVNVPAGGFILTLRRTDGVNTVTVYTPDNDSLQVHSGAPVRVTLAGAAAGGQFDYQVSSESDDWAFEFSINPVGDIAKD